MAGGGTAGYTEVETYQTDAHRMLLTGRDSKGLYWSGYSPSEGSVTAVSVVFGGTGHSEDELLIINDGDSNCLLIVTGVSGGSVTTVAVQNGGSGYTVATPLGTYPPGFPGSPTDITVSVDTVGDSIALGGDYQDSPSVLRFLLERGLTDVGGNPYEGVSGYDPSLELDEINAALGDLKTTINGLAPATDFASDMATAITEAGDADSELDVASVVTTVLSSALASAAAAITASMADSHTAVKTVIDDAITRASASASTTASGVIDDALAKAQTVFTTAVSAVAADTGLNPSIDAMFDLALTVARQGATDLIADAFAGASALIDRGLIDQAVEAFEDDTLPTYLSEVNRFAGGMADINAVNSSTFIIGMAIIAGRRQSDVNKYRAELNLQTYRDALTQFVQISPALLQQYLTAYSQEKAANVALYESVTTILQGASQTELEALRMFFGGEQGMVGATSAEWNRVYSGDESGYLNSVISARLQEKQSRIGLISMGATEIGQRRDRAVTFEHGYDALLAEVNRMSIVAKTEDQERNLTYDVQSLNWDLDLFSKAGNVLSAVTGSVVPVPDRPTRAQTALSVALGVASIAVPYAGGVAGLLNRFGGGGGGQQGDFLRNPNS